jgi:hypothetical protein
MRVRTAIASTAHRVRLTAVGWALTTVLACVALSACTGGSTPSVSSSVSLFPPSASRSGSVTTPTSSASPSVSQSTSPPASPSPSVTTLYSPPPSTYYSPYPTAAPVTGGGGTAGFQDAGLAVLGGAAIVAGLGSIAYRRRITRNR